MRSSIAASVALLAAGSVAQDSSCAEGLYMLVARGTGEAAGVGITGKLGDAISAKIKNSKVVALEYPATFTDPAYTDSEGDGAKSLEDAITKYHKDCPKGKLAVLGYSQGAQVSMDVICGGPGGLFNTNAPIDKKIIDDSVVAFALFGDPTHIANKTYDAGTSIKNGIFQRNDTSKCELYSDKLISYCNTGDIYCDSGKNTTVHDVYFMTDFDAAAKYVVDKYEKAVKGGSSSSSTGSATGTAKPTGSATGTASESAKPTGTGASNSTVTTTGPKESTSGTGSPSSKPTKPANSAAGSLIGSTMYAAVPAALFALSQLLL